MRDTDITRGSAFTWYLPHAAHTNDAAGARTAQTPHGLRVQPGQIGAPAYPTKCAIRYSR